MSDSRTICVQSHATTHHHTPSHAITCNLVKLATHLPLLPISDFLLDVFPRPDLALVIVVIAIGVTCVAAYMAARIATTAAKTRFGAIAAEANISLGSTSGVGNVATAIETTTAITAATSTATNIATTASTDRSLIGKADVKTTTLATSSVHPARAPPVVAVSSLRPTHPLSAGTEVLTSLLHPLRAR